MTEPNKQQLKDFVKICEILTTNLAPILLVKMNERTNDLLIFAGENIEIVIDDRGRATYDQFALQGDGYAEYRDQILENRDDEKLFCDFSGALKTGAKPLNLRDLPEILQRQI